MCRWVEEIQMDASTAAIAEVIRQLKTGNTGWTAKSEGG